MSKNKKVKTIAMWLWGGQFHCDGHKAGVPFFFAPQDAQCAECSGNAPNSYLKREVNRGDQ